MSIKLGKEANQIVSSELERIRESYGDLNAKDVVVEATSESSPLHKYFEWDDSKAGSSYREWQARQLIKSVVIVYEDETPAPMYWSIKSPDPDKVQSYHHIDEIRSDVDLHKEALLSAVKELEHWRKVYNYLSELKPVVNEEALEAVKKDIDFKG